MAHDLQTPLEYNFVIYNNDIQFSLCPSYVLKKHFYWIVISPTCVNQIVILPIREIRIYNHSNAIELLPDYLMSCLTSRLIILFMIFIVEARWREAKELPPPDSRELI